jgi:diguanylate cyclase (GGDEF)-like protein
VPLPVPTDAWGASLTPSSRRRVVAGAVLLLAGALITTAVETPGVGPFLLTTIDLPVRGMCVAALAGAAAHHRRQGSAGLFVFLTLAALLDLVAAGVFRAAVLLPGSTTQQLGDLLQLGAYLSVVVALLAIPRTNRWRSAQLSTLDALVAVGGFGLVVWYLLIRPAPVYVGDDPTLAALTEVAYPVLDAAMLTVLIARSRSGLTILPSPVRWMLVVAVVAAFVGDGFIGLSFYVARAPFFLVGSAVSHAVSTLALLVLGEMGRRVELQAPGAPDPRADAALPPLAAAAAVLVLAVMGRIVWAGGAIDRVLFIGGIGLAALIALRQVLAARRHVHWLRDREQRLASEVADRTAELAVANAQLQALATSDGLTGIANRRHFDAVLEARWRDSQRHGQPLALLLLDVDAFKAYNDRYGHGPGDQVLVRVAAALQSAVRRQTDLVARYGGEEFVILCPSTTAEGARAFASAVLAAVRGAAIPHAASPVAPIVTVSIGVTAGIAAADGDPRRFVEIADQALYDAKRAGRDRAVFRGAVAPAGDAPVVTEV